MAACQGVGTTVTQIPGIQYASPHTFTTRQQLILNVGVPAVSACLKMLTSTCRCEVRNLDYWEDIQRTHDRVIVAIWHASAVLAAHHYRNTGFHTLASGSFDGEFGARVIRRFGILSVRGSSGHGGSDALRDLAKALEHVRVVGFTLDGPRGPRRVAKPGVAILAARTGAPVIPHAFTVHPAWRLHSWDRFPIPKPFARVISAYGPAIPPPPNEDPEEIEAMRVRVETGLNQVHEQIEAHPDQ